MSNVNAEVAKLKVQYDAGVSSDSKAHAVASGGLAESALQSAMRAMEEARAKMRAAQARAREAMARAKAAQEEAARLARAAQADAAAEATKMANAAAAEMAAAQQVEQVAHQEMTQAALQVQAAEEAAKLTVLQAQEAALVAETAAFEAVAQTQLPFEEAPEIPVTRTLVTTEATSLAAIAAAENLDLVELGALNPNKKAIPIPSGEPVFVPVQSVSSPMTQAPSAIDRPGSVPKSKVAQSIPPSDSVPIMRSTAGRPNVRVNADSTGIHSLQINGQNVLTGGGYYIVGGVSAQDNTPKAFMSYQSQPGYLQAPAKNHVPIPYTMSITGTNPIRVSVSIGPLPEDLKTISMPMDFNKALMNSFAHSQSSYLVGAAASWSLRSGSSGAYADIPTPANIPGCGPVGAARVTSAPDGSWMEISGPGGTVRRTIIESNIAEMKFFNHPGTNNLELSWVPEPASNACLPAGSMLHLTEEITISA